MSRNGHLYFPFRLDTLFIIFQAVLALLSGRIQVNQATIITVSPSSLVFPSTTIQRLQSDFTTNSWSLYQTNMASLKMTAAISSVFLTPSSSSTTQSSVYSRHTKTLTSSVSPTTNKPVTVTQSNHTNAPAMPTTVLIIKGLPSEKVIAAIAGVLGAILLVLFAIIAWHLCIVESLPRRPSSRVEPTDITGSVTELV